MKPKKVRTSFELSDDTVRFLESKAEALGIPPSEVFRQIIAETEIETEQHQKRVKNLTVYQSHMEKLEKIAEALIPDKWKGKRSGSKSDAAEILVKSYMKNCK